MTFNSLQYALFLPAVVALHWLLPKRARLPLIVVASYVFYGSWDHRFLLLLLISTVSDYLIALMLGRTEYEFKRKLLLVASLVINLGILGFFKYFNFFVDSAGVLLSNIGLEPNRPLLEIILPVGISFYTFQTLSYTIDVYRRRIEPCRNPVLFGAFVAYFPGLVAGPIERAQRLLPRLEASRDRPDAQQIYSALVLIVSGLFKKIVLADQMAPLVDATFSSPDKATGLGVAMALVAFSIQVYGDFSGYSDIARGSSRLLSIELMVNFRQPFLSRSITEFWRRWHISLSTWLRDYLYVPLGGSRGSGLATYRNLIVTMTLGGLWHGAGWTYVLWGALQGTMLSAHRAMGSGATEKDRDHVRFREVPYVVATFTLICLSWLLFRADNLDTTVALAQDLFLWRGPMVISPEVLQVGLWLLVMLGMDLAERSASYERERDAIRRPILSGALAGTGLTLIILYSGSASVPFIYFQF